MRGKHQKYDFLSEESAPPIFFSIHLKEAVKQFTLMFKDTTAITVYWRAS